MLTHLNDCYYRLVFDGIIIKHATMQYTNATYVNAANHLTGLKASSNCSASYPTVVPSGYWTT